jgi:hypothetical protein
LRLNVLAAVAAAVLIAAPAAATAGGAPANCAKVHACNLSLKVSARMALAGEPVAGLITLTASGQPVAGAPVLVEVAGGAPLTPTSWLTTNLQGQARFVYTLRTDGSVTFTAVSGSAIAHTQVNWVYRYHLALVQVSTAIAAGSSTTLYAELSGGPALAGQTVVFNADDGLVASPGSATTNADGVATTTLAGLYPTSAPTEVQASVTVNGTTLTAIGPPTVVTSTVTEPGPGPCLAAAGLRAAPRTASCGVVLGLTARQP